MRSTLEKLLTHPDCAEGVLWQRQRVKSKEMVFRQGDTGRDVYVVLSGVVQVIGAVELEGQRRINSGFFELGSGAIFGEFALFDSKPRSASVMAVNDCELAIIDGQALLSFFDSHTDLGYVVLKELIALMIERLRKTNSKLLALFAWGLKVHDIDKHL